MPSRWRVTGSINGTRDSIRLALNMSYRMGKMSDAPVGSPPIRLHPSHCHTRTTHRHLVSVPQSHSAPFFPPRCSLILPLLPPLFSPLLLLPLPCLPMAEPRRTYVYIHISSPLLFASASASLCAYLRVGAVWDVEGGAVGPGLAVAYHGIQGIHLPHLRTHSAKVREQARLGQERERTGGQGG